MPITKQRKWKPFVNTIFNEDGSIKGTEVFDRRGRKSFKCDRLKLAPGVYVPKFKPLTPVTGGPVAPTFVE